MTASPPSAIAVLALLALLAALLAEAFVDHALADGAGRRLRPPARAGAAAVVRPRGGVDSWR
ncbi:hypothetical protein [Phaeacidiphilus oryzae]|uniref:hypothetical protein n=1 Tax=Phaeacidiphilus oryzae TaxID=348818 RepID=UPI00055E410C|nr:hypothetical protein [Phaeacidiphilus oryzae]